MISTIRFFNGQKSELMESVDENEDVHTHPRETYTLHLQVPHLYLMSKTKPGSSFQILATRTNKELSHSFVQVFCEGSISSKKAFATSSKLVCTLVNV